VLVLSATSQIDEYEIVVATGGQPDAGTDVPVTFTLIGSGGRSVSTTIDPSQSSLSAKPFRVNGTDTFKVIMLDLCFWFLLFFWFVGVVLCISKCLLRGIGQGSCSHRIAHKLLTVVL
jgi:hypothetical protein